MSPPPPVSDPFRCPNCGSTVALASPSGAPREDEVTVKCLVCAHVVRLPRKKKEAGQ